MEKYVYTFLDALFRLADYVTSHYPALTYESHVEPHVKRIKFSSADYSEEAV